jgi:uncharacterized membrane protein SirB2
MRRLFWALAIAFVLLGIFVAASRDFERWAGQELQEAAPAARQALPAPAKAVLRKGREILPIYGAASDWVVRKSASIVYFGIVGLFALAARRRRPETLRETLLVTVLAGVGMSLIVEILEWPEALGSEIFDLACGAVGGVIAGFVAWLWLRRKAPTSAWNRGG